MGAFVAPLPLRCARPHRTHASPFIASSRGASCPTAPAPAPLPSNAPRIDAHTEQPASGGVAPHTVVVWFRCDLRLHDNPCLTGLEQCAVAPLLLLPHAPAQSLLDAAHDLRAALRQRGTELYVRHAGHDVALAVRRFCQSVHATHLHFAADVTREARVLEQRVQREVASAGVSVAKFWSGGLLSPDQLPFGVQDLPEDCDAFAEAVRGVSISEPLPVPRAFCGVSDVACGQIPGRRLGAGGERVALRGLDEYCTGALAKVQAGKLHTSFGRLGPFLEMGCVSPRLLWDRVVKRGERSVRRYCAEFELMWREFARFTTLKHGELPAY